MFSGGNLAIQSERFTGFQKTHLDLAVFHASVSYEFHGDFSEMVPSKENHSTLDGLTLHLLQNSRKKETNP